MSDYQLIPFGDLQQMATVVAKAGCFGFKTMEQAAALMLEDKERYASQDDA